MKTSAEMRALLAAARVDGPDAESRDAMWTKLQVGIGFVPSAEGSGVRVGENAARSTPPAPPNPPVAAASAAKGSVLKAGLLGGGIGSVLTAGAVLVALRVGVPVLGPTPQSESLHETRAAERAPSILAPIATPQSEPAKSSETGQAPRVRAGGTAAALDDSDALSREVAFVMDAREALILGDADRALTLARKARALQGQLGREALTLEVRALRALGRDADADRAEMELRVRHPNAR